MEQVELTPEQKRLWGEMMMLMGWKAPGFQHLWYTMLAKNDGQHVAVMTKDIPIAATDGKNVLVNPDTFFKYGLQGQLYIACHEIVHNMYGDVELFHRCREAGFVPMNDGTKLPYDEMTMQCSADMRINALLNESRMGVMPKDAVFDPKVKPTDSILDVYKSHYKKKPDKDGDEESEGQGGKGMGKGSQGGGHGSGQPPPKGTPNSGFDQVLKPGASQGKDPDQAAQERNDSQWQMEMATAQILEDIKSQGRMAGALTRLFKDLLEPEIPWQEKITSTVQRTLGSGSYTWRRPDRRFIGRDIYLPSRTGLNAGWIVIWGDTSGSMGELSCRSYIKEIPGILDGVKPKRLTMIWCDAAISKVDEYTEVADLQASLEQGVAGGGDTSNDPIFDWINENSLDQKPDMFIGFTDGYVHFPSKEPDFPVIWASTTDAKYPWGDVVRINKKKE